MAEHFQPGEVGAVGARLLNPNGTIEQAGTVVGVNNTAQAAFHALPGEHPGTNRQLQGDTKLQRCLERVYAHAA